MTMTDPRVWLSSCYIWAIWNPQQWDCWISGICWVDLSLIQLEKVVGENWPWFGKYGDELLEVFNKLTISPLEPKPKQPRDQKKERTTKHSRMSRTSSSKKPTQIPDPSSALVNAVIPLPPTLPASATPAQPLPHNPYMHLLTPTGSSPLSRLSASVSKLPVLLQFSPSTCYSSSSL